MWQGIERKTRLHGGENRFSPESYPRVSVADTLLPRELQCWTTLSILVDRNGIILGVSAVLFGITALMLIVGVVVSPFFLFVALPFGGSAYLLWYQASGRLAERIERDPAGAVGGDRTAGFDPGPFGGRTADATRSARERTRRTRRNRQRASPNAPSESTLSAADARQILDVDPTADESEIKAAYRRKAKQNHPDTASGDEETFKSVSRAYETLRQ